MTMKVGHAHNWNYHSNWKEKKVAPGRWKFFSSQTKTRLGHQYSRIQGAKVGATFHWGIKAKQILRKISPNSYRGHMKGTKIFLGRR